MMCRPSTPREQVLYVWRWLSSHVVALYMGGMFTAMAVIRFVEPEGVSGTIIGESAWPLVYFSVAHLIAAGLVWPESSRLAALTGTAIVMTAAARIGAIGALTWDLWRCPDGCSAQASAGLVAVLLWGLVMVVGLRWPHLAQEAEVRSLIVEASSQKANAHGVG